jgi:hypothetical protein
MTSVDLGPSERDREFVAPDIHEGGERWLNAEHEQSRRALMEYVEQKAEQYPNGGELLLALLHESIPGAFDYGSRFERFVTQEERSSIFYQRADTKLATEIAGEPIQRFVFVVEDDEVYKKIERSLHQQSGTSHGLTVPGMVFANHPEWRDASVLITTNRPGVIAHEIQHSIDPTPSRQGYDRLLEELFAYIADKRNEVGIDWQQVANFTADPYYYTKYSSGLKEADRIQPEEWRKLVAIAVRSVQDLVQWNGEVSTLQKLGKTASVNELLIAWNEAHEQQ